MQSLIQVHAISANFDTYSYAALYRRFIHSYYLLKFLRLRVYCSYMYIFIGYPLMRVKWRTTYTYQILTIQFSINLQMCVCVCWSLGVWQIEIKNKINESLQMASFQWLETKLTKQKITQWFRIFVVYNERASGTRYLFIRSLSII